MNNNTETTQETSGLKSYLSPVGVWALSFGCAVGWGAFVMPGTTFLPVAGPLGTALGMFLGAVIMLIIGINYHYLMKRYPDAGGTLTYVTKTFGYDHGFLSAWFLVLVYVAIVWANATALVLIARNLLGKVFQFGFHYTLLGYDVYFGEILISVFAIILFGLLCIYGKSFAAILQSIMAVILCLGILTCFVFVVAGHRGGAAGLYPLFAPNGRNPLSQIMGILVLAPWAFVGFESVSHSAEELKFPVAKTIKPIIFALLASMAAYVLLSLTAVSVLPDGFSSWPEYLNRLDSLEGLEGLPVFYAVHSVMGRAGIYILGITLLSALITGLIGHYLAASRLVYSMAKDDILPRQLGELNKNGVPQKALMLLIGLSIIVPFLGRTAIGWIVDVTTIGATIAYGYTSAAAHYEARKEGNGRIKKTGILGIIFALGFFVYFMMSTTKELSTESYLILAVWSILGFFYFRYVFKKDTKRRFGQSTVVWLGLLFLIFFTSLMWIRNATDDMTQHVVKNISNFYEEKLPELRGDHAEEAEEFVESQMDEANRLLTRNSIIQMLIIIAALAIMFSIFTNMRRREREMEIEKVKAEENSRAKSTFLSNMSHDIRTPMNAIIGYINLSKREDMTIEDFREYMGKIESSSQHLLALINDVLEMSRIESGKMELELIETDLKKTFVDIKDMFSTQMETKQIDFSVNTSNVSEPYVYCDKNRLNRVLLNLISNAYKFTPEGGTISVNVSQEKEEEGFCTYKIKVADSGIGMSPEFAAKVFEAFERENNSTVSGIQGTGLGMAITKSIVDLMGGTIEVNTALNRGTEFVVTLSFELQKDRKHTDDKEQAQGKEVREIVSDFSRMRLLLAEDMVINREIAVMLLGNLGFKTETAENGKEAVEKVMAADPGYYDAVLMDIQMPVMDGYEAAKAIRALEDKEKAGIPIVAMTANAFSEDVKKAQSVGMNAHIAKPIDVNAMVNTLHDILG